MPYLGWRKGVLRRREGVKGCLNIVRSGIFVGWMFLCLVYISLGNSPFHFHEYVYWPGLRAMNTTAMTSTLIFSSLLCALAVAYADICIPAWQSSLLLPPIKVTLKSKKGFHYDYRLRFQSFETISI